jgi:hypothetical protein
MESTLAVNRSVAQALEAAGGKQKWQDGQNASWLRMELDMGACYCAERVFVFSLSQLTAP